MSTSVVAKGAQQISYKTAWFVIAVASLFFFYEYIQENVFDTINFSLRTAFSINATKVGELSSYYFWANVIFLFVAGAILDRYSTRKVILATLGLCVIGTALFATAHTFFWAAFFRFVTGIGSAFCFLSVIRLASRWFPASKMALVIGVVVTIAFVGGMVAQWPFAMLAKVVPWRMAILFDSVLGVVIFVLIYLFVKDYPASHEKTHREEQEAISELGYWKSLRMAFLRIRNWIPAIYTCLMNLPVIVLGGLWGIPYLVTTHALTRIDAASVTSVLFFGVIVGCPIAGWISDAVKLRRLPMIIGAIISIVLLGLVVLIPELHYVALLLLFFSVGVCTSTQIISYPLVAESSPRIITAMSVSVINITTQGGIAIFQPVYGYLMDIHAMKRLHHATEVYIRSDYNWSMWVLLIGLVVALLAAFAVRETHAKHVET